MNLVTISIKSIKQRLLSSSLTALSVALGVMLMVAVLIINGVVSDLFSQPSFGFNLVVGPKGSDLSLALSAIYRLDKPGEPLPYLFYKELKEHRAVEKAVPIAIGDVTQQGAFPIVGTIPEFFDLDYAYGKPFRVRGEFLKTPWDAVIGSRVAATNGWGIGSEFKLIHGGAESDHVHDEKFRVVGVLAPTGTPNDRTAFVSLAGFWAIAGHEKPLKEAVDRLEKFRYPVPQSLRETVAEPKKGHDHGHDHDHGLLDEQKEVTAIFIRTKSTAGSIALAGEINEDVRALAVNPIFPMKRLMTMIVDNIKLMLLTLTSLIIVVSAVSIFVSIYNSMADRRREIGIMRALGARRETVFAIILAESALLCLGGGVIGLLLGHGIVAVASPIIESRSGILVNPLSFEPLELVLFPVLLVLGSLIGFLPGLAAYRTDVAAALSE
ncbi:MAG: FtsX-like permease family protein [Planctomycetes bacterium]|nr:FtsX-like permease family protein [Planctomycetota bacterium]